MHLFGLLLLVVLSSPEHLEVVQGAVVRSHTAAGSDAPLHPQGPL